MIRSVERASRMAQRRQSEAVTQFFVRRASEGAPPEEE